MNWLDEMLIWFLATDPYQEEEQDECEVDLSIF